MTVAESVYDDLASSIPDAVKAKMFGALCLKVNHNGKAFIMLWKGFMIFKLEGIELKNALSLDGAKLFDPAGVRPMGGWVQLDDSHIDKWHELAKQAFDYVSTLKK